MAWDTIGISEHDFLIMKSHLQIWAVLTVAAIVLLVYLMRRKVSPVAAVADGATPPITTAVPSYPNAQPITLPNTSSQLAPLDLTYNQPENGQGMLPTVQVAGPSATPGGGVGCGCDDDCVAAGTFVTVNHVPATVLGNAASNLSGFQGKFFVAAHSAVVNL